jgi:hypothetical protein
MQRELIPLVPSDPVWVESAGLPIPALDARLLDELVRPRLALFWGTQEPTRMLLAAATTLAARGLPLRLFDGGNRFDGYFVARLARRLSAHPVQAGALGVHGPQATLGRIHISRAFTCFQLAELIENAPAGPEPLFVLDLLATFYDESVPLRDSERLLESSISHLKRLAAAGPVIVGARQPQSLVKERWTLLDRLETAADAAWMLRSPPVEEPLQPRLF